MPVSWLPTFLNNLVVNLDAVGTVWRVNQAAYTPTEVTRGYASLDNIAEPEIRSIRHFLPDTAGVRKARRTLHAKAISIAAVFATGYYLAVIGNRHPLLHLAGIVLIAHACVAAATGIMHDANHSAFSKNKGLNKAAAVVADALGASSWMWRFQHNLTHHRHTNVQTLDDDIEQMPFLRLSDHQETRWYFRYQHIYAWFLYCFLTVKWLFVGDFGKLASKTITYDGVTREVRTSTVVGVVGGKLAHASWALAIPLLLHSWYIVIASYLAIAFFVSFSLSVVFQLAHCVEEAQMVPSDTEHGGAHTLNHQLKTTVNIESGNKVAGWYMGWMYGGLDNQIEHHLAPRFPHTCYKDMSNNVRKYCQETGLKYLTHKSLTQGVLSHYRHLRTMALGVSASA